MKKKTISRQAGDCITLTPEQQLELAPLHFQWAATNGAMLEFAAHRQKASEALWAKVYEFFPDLVAYEMRFLTDGTLAVIRRADEAKVQKNGK